MRYTLNSGRDVACNVSTTNYVPHEYEKCYILLKLVLVKTFINNRKNVNQCYDYNQEKSKKLGEHCPPKED